MLKPITIKYALIRFSTAVLMLGVGISLGKKVAGQKLGDLPPPPPCLSGAKVECLSPPLFKILGAIILFAPTVIYL